MITYIIFHLDCPCCGKEYGNFTICSTQNKDIATVLASDAQYDMNIKHSGHIVRAESIEYKDQRPTHVVIDRDYDGWSRIFYSKDEAFQYAKTTLGDLYVLEVPKEDKDFSITKLILSHINHH